MEKRKVYVIFELMIIVYILFLGDNVYVRFGCEFWVLFFESLESL